VGTLGIFSAVVMSATWAWGSVSFDNHRLDQRFQSLEAAPVSASLEAGIFQQDVDHSGLLPGVTFAQRYWVDSEYAGDSGAPVIYHICGEGDAAKAYFLHDNAIAWAKALGARLVFLEHRYYGESLPFADLTTEHLRFLTLDNEIEDLAAFQKWISAANRWTGKWISVGGSYSGTISAIYRLRHPELVVGALASSAPMISGKGRDEGTSGDVDQLSPTDPAATDGMRSWVYQSCTTFGFWETNGWNLFEPSAWLCGQLFPGAPLTDKAAYNQAYYSPFVTGSAPSASNILFTYGSEDIWTTIGISPADVSNSGIAVILISGAGQHYDLNYPSARDSAAVQAAREKFLALARRWLN
jgi:pimeloyl-ACP methyl ester carboxylesterase